MTETLSSEVRIAAAEKVAIVASRYVDKIEKGLPARLWETRLIEAVKNYRAAKEA